MTGIYLFFYYYKYHRHYYRIYYYHFLFYPKRTFFFPRVTIYFLGGFPSKTACIEGNCSFETSWTFDAGQCSRKFHIKKSRFLSNSVFFTVLEWVSVRSRLVIKFSLRLPFKKSLTVASGMLWRRSLIVDQNVFMKNDISIL